MCQDGGWQVQHHGQSFALAKLGPAGGEEGGAAHRGLAQGEQMREGFGKCEKKLWDWREWKRSPQWMGRGGAESRVRVKGTGMKGGECVERGYELNCT